MDLKKPQGLDRTGGVIADGRPSELEAWNGAAARMEPSAVVAVPVHTFTYASLLAEEKTSRQRRART
jgi:2-dehydropantoate 2-reductase